MHRWNLSSVNKEGTFQDLISGRHGVVSNNGGEEQQGILSLQDTSSATINFRDSCISNPSLCEQGLSVSFWLRHKRELPSCDVFIFTKLVKFIKLMQAFLNTLPPSGRRCPPLQWKAEQVIGMPVMFWHLFFIVIVIYCRLFCFKGYLTDSCFHSIVCLTNSGKRYQTE